MLVKCRNRRDRIKVYLSCLLEWLKCREYAFESEQMTHLKPRLALSNTRRRSPPLTSTAQTALIHKDSIFCVQKSRACKRTGFEGPNSCRIFSPRLGPAARKNIWGKEWTSQQKQPADLAESSFMGPGKCGLNKIEVNLLLNYQTHTSVTLFWHGRVKLM